MKGIIPGAAAVAVISTVCGAAYAVDVTDTWRGAIVVTAASAGCEGLAFPQVGQSLMAVFRPRFVGSDPNTGFMVTFANGALLVTPTSTAIPSPASGDYTGSNISGAAAAGDYTGGRYSLRTRPANITPTTPGLSISGRITKFRNKPGCTVSFKGGLTKGVL